MNPDIKRYLDEHGATYTREALRQGLVDAGHDPAEVDAALGSWTPDPRASGPGVEQRRTFSRWALGLHLLALLAVFGALIILKGTAVIGSALLGCAVLAVALLIGWSISSMIGRALLPGAGTIAALIVPAISAVILGGACFGLMNSVIPTPPHEGTMRLEIQAPLAFQGSGSAACYLRDGTVQIDSHDLGTLDGRLVTVFLYWYGEANPNRPAPAEGASLSISLSSTSPADRPLSWTSEPSGKITVDGSSSGHSGTMEFEGLSPEILGEPGASLDPSLEPISGTINWTCE
jgi:hypothetical protein